MSNIEKTFTTLEIVNIVSYLNQMTDEQTKCLPTKFRWNLKKNLEKLLPLAKRFEDFRNDISQEFQSAWFTDERSEEFEQPIMDDNGNPAVDSDGNQLTNTVRRIKKEFMSDYDANLQEQNGRLREILEEENDVMISAVDFEAFVDGLDDDSPIDFDALNILCFMDETTNVKEAE